MSTSACTRLDDAIADVLDGTASDEVIEHLVSCDRCRDARHDAERVRDFAAKAGADYVVPTDLVDRLMASIDAPTSAIQPHQPLDEHHEEQTVIVDGAEVEGSEEDRAATHSDQQQQKVPAEARGRLLARALRKRSSWLLLVAASLSALALAFAVFRARHITPTASFEGRVALVVRAGKDINGKSGLEVCKSGSSTTSCRQAITGENLAAGDRIRTDARTRARLDLSDGTHLVLDRDTDLELTPGDRRSAKLARGMLSADVAHLEKVPNAHFDLPHASIDVIGTSFVLTATEDMSLVEVTRGEVALNASGAGGAAAKPLPVRAGREGRVAAGHAPVISTLAIGGESRDWSDLVEGTKTDTADADAPLRGIGELRAKKPGETRERDRGVRLARHHVKVRIAGNVARTEIDESFANESADELEGIYRMPLPPDAQIERLALEVNGKLEEGAFVARDRAKAIWGGVIHHAAPEKKAEPDIVWVPGPWRDPALLEWQRGGRFELRIFPIPARGSRRVVLAYTQTLPLHGAVRRYTYPLAYDPSGSTTIDDFDVDVQVMGHNPTFGVKSRGYTLSRSSDEGERTARLHTSAQAFVPAGDLALEYTLPNDEAELTTWTYAPPTAGPGGGGTADKDAYLAMAIRPKLPAFEENRDRLYVIVVDSSRSMFGERFRRASSVVSTFVRDLDRRDQYFVLTCNTECRSLTDGAASPGPSSSEDVSRGLATIQPEGAHDPTLAVRAALQRAIAGKKMYVVYVGDGGASAGTTKPDRISKIVAADASAHGASVTSIAIGADADINVLAAVARGGGGALVRDAGQGQSASALALSAIAMTRGTILKHPTIKLPAGLRAIAPETLDSVPEGGEAYVVARIEPGIDAVRGSIELDGEVGGEKYHQTFAIDTRISSSAGNAFVPRLYAASRIADLERTKGDAAKDEIIRLSRDHAVASRFTSMLVLESEAMFRAFGVERGAQRSASATWSGEDTAETTSTDGDEHHAPRPSLSPTPSIALPSHSPMSSALPPGSSANECSVPYTFDANGVKRYKPSCLGDRHSHLNRSDIPPVEPPPPPRPPLPTMRPMGKGAGWVPMERTWVRRGSFATTSIPSVDEAKIVAAEAALAQQPDNRTRMSALVRAYAAAGRVEPAADHVRQWLARDPLDLDALALRSELVGRVGERDEEVLILGSIVDLRPEDAKAQLRLARVLEALGQPARACAHRISAAEANAKDLDNVGAAIRCALATAGLESIADEIARGLSDIDRRKVDASNSKTAATANAANAANADLRGDVQITASWDAPIDLDIALVDSAGRRYSWTGLTGNPTVRDATSPSRESIGLSGLAAGTYVVELTSRAGVGGSPSAVSGTIDAKIVNHTASRVPFTTTGGARAVIGVVTITREQQLTPIRSPMIDRLQNGDPWRSERGF